jgi:chromate transporter
MLSFLPNSPCRPSSLSAVDCRLSANAPPDSIGPGTSIVVMLGRKLGGLVGSVVAAIGIFLPSSLLVYALAHIWFRHSATIWQRAIEIGLQPVAAGMTIVSALTLLQAASVGAIAWTIGPSRSRTADLSRRAK